MTLIAEQTLLTPEELKSLGFSSDEKVYHLRYRKLSGELVPEVHWLIDFDFHTEIPQIRQFYDNFAADKANVK